MSEQQNYITKIRKRDDRIVEFDLDKINSAIWKAMKATKSGSQELSKRLSQEVVKKLHQKFHERSIPAVEEVQDIVEEVLIENRELKAAKAYIIYRDQHKQMREMQKRIDGDALVDGYLERMDWRVRENSNMDFSLQGLNNHVSSAISSHYWLNKVYPPNIREAHNSGDLHIHDLQIFSVYCVGWDLRDLLMHGFGGVTGKIESSPPKHFRVALGQLVNLFYTLQGEAAGAQAISNFDTYLAPFIRYDDLSYKQVKQSLQEFLFNMNVPTRVGFQTPFTNVTLDLVVPSNVAEEAVVIGGKLQEKKYKEFQREMDMFNEAYAEVMMEGDAKGRVFTFPIPTYNVTADLDWDNPIIDKVMEMTAKYGVPYFANFVNSEMKPEDARSMCCRLRLDNRELRKRGGGLFGANPLTGSIGVVTLNMPRIGYLCSDKEEFLQKVSGLMDMAKESLIIKRKVLERFTESGLYPYSKHYLRSVKDRFGEYWKNHFNTIGLNGMNEAMLNLFGEGISSPQGYEFSKEVLGYMRDRMMEYQEKEDSLFNLEATPAEGTSYRFARLDKERYPDIIVANEEAYQQKGADPYYTNSTHLPVNYTDDMFEALQLQDELQTMYTGGTVFHGFVGEKMPDIQSTKNLVKKISENYRLPYFTITPTFSVCPKHGYIAGEHEYCPKCDEEAGYSEIVEKQEQSA